MKKQVGLVSCMIVGSFCIYCAQGPEKPADAALGPSTFVKLAEGDLATPGATSPAIAVGAYGEIVVYLTVHPDYAVMGCEVAAQFRPDVSSAFGSTGQNVVNNALGMNSNGSTQLWGARIRVDGPELQLLLPSAVGPNPCTAPYHYIVAGVQ